MLIIIVIMMIMEILKPLKNAFTSRVPRSPLSPRFSITFVGVEGRKSNFRPPEWARFWPTPGPPFGSFLVPFSPPLRAARGPQTLLEPLPTGRAGGREEPQNGPLFGPNWGHKLGRNWPISVPQNRRPNQLTSFALKYIHSCAYHTGAVP